MNYTDGMFDRAEALQNTAKAIKGLKALDEEALEVLYLEAKAERRERARLVAENAKPFLAKPGDVTMPLTLSGDDPVTITVSTEDTGVLIVYTLNLGKDWDSGDFGAAVSKAVSSIGK